ncbi:M4 family metallopeptidase [Streptomyces sp. A7024]|uniref:Neutral metalloproteinase n=2 Tax=Streptomyces coryli TaxID=1128680 RepID=A0A6G4U1S8_9ACTN|nr:M4 family metallopeptidase [Streptomyces coryli]
MEAVPAVLRTGVIPLALQERLTEERGAPLDFGWPRPLAARARRATRTRDSVGDAGFVILDAQHEDSADLDRFAVARAEGEDEVSDAAVNRVYDGIVATRKFLSEVFHRQYVGAEGEQLTVVVHYAEKYNNGFWNGEAVFLGDGDGAVFTSFGQGLEMAAYHLLAGLPELESLTYFGQSGALNTSLRETFGLLVKQYALGQTAEEADWLVGAGLLAPGIKGVALRSFKAPGTAYDDPVLGKDPQPHTMDGYVVTGRDNGGIHMNSGIPNRAFYLAARGFGGHAWERAGRIWWEVLTSGQLGVEPEFADLARLTSRAARARYGDGQRGAVIDRAWSRVGLPPAESPRRTPSA